MGPEIPYPQEGTWDQRYPTPNPRKGHGPGTEPECRVGPQMNKIEQVSGHITTPIHLGVGYGGLPHLSNDACDVPTLLPPAECLTPVKTLPSRNFFGGQ